MAVSGAEGGGGGGDVDGALHGYASARSVQRTKAIDSNIGLMNFRNSGLESGV